jgi:iron complex outermembrane receptor protein
MGVVWSPTFATGLNLALDWWNIRIENTIVADAPDTILNDCYVQSIASRCSPQLFTRDPALGYINFLQFGGRNAGFREVEGVDFDVSYRTTTDLGTFSVVANNSYTSKDVSVSTNDPRVPLSAVCIAGSGSTTFRVRSNVNAGWTRGAFGVSWIARYYPSIKEGCTCFVPGNTGPALEPNLECDDIGFKPTGLVTGTTSQLTRRVRHGSNTFHDIEFRFEAPWNASVAIGANNVFERSGPVMYSQPNANVSYYGGFDIGRFIYMRYTQKFQALFSFVNKAPGFRGPFLLAIREVPVLTSL